MKKTDTRWKSRVDEASKLRLVECVDCGASPGDPCRSPHGRATHPHRWRYHATILDQADTINRLLGRLQSKPKRVVADRNRNRHRDAGKPLPSDERLDALVVPGDTD